MKKTLTIAIAILLSGCNASNNKLSTFLDLDSAINNNSIENVKISRTREMELSRKNLDTVITDDVVFPDGDNNDYSQKIEIYYMNEVLNSKIVRYFQNKKLKYEAECINGWIEGEKKHMIR
jgi:hypothetical protein